MQAVSLFGLTAVASYMRIAYLVVVLLMMAAGAQLLLSQNRRARYKSAVSLCLNGVGVLLFILGSQPYAAAFIFVFLIIKVFMLIKKQ